jgi:hypothetical protein
MAVSALNSRGRAGHGWPSRTPRQAGVEIGTNQNNGCVIFRAIRNPNATSILPVRECEDSAAAGIWIPTSSAR